MIFKEYGNYTAQGLTQRVEVSGLGILLPNTSVHFRSFQELSRPPQYMGSTQLVGRTSQRESYLLDTQGFSELLKGPLLGKAGVMILNEQEREPSVHCTYHLQGGLEQAVSVPLVLHTLSRGWEESEILPFKDELQVLLDISPFAFKQIWQTRRLPENVNFKLDQAIVNFNAFRLGRKGGIIVKPD